MGIWGLTKDVSDRLSLSLLRHDQGLWSMVEGVLRELDVVDVL
jgi:hypothetical protein